MLVTVDHTEAHNAIRESLRTQLKRHGYHLTDAEIDDVSRNVLQSLMLLDTDPLDRVSSGDGMWNP